MSYSKKMQKNNLYSVYLAPRRRVRMVELGIQIAQHYLSPFDHIIGIVGAAGSGKSMLIKGMFPGVDLTNDDGGVNIRPLPLLEVHEKTFYAPHTYHVDIRFEAAFTPLHELATAILEVAKQEKRVIVEHFEMIYPVLKRNADLLIGIGEEIIITRPTLFGPDPQNVADLVYKTINYRMMAHTAEDLCVMCLNGGTTEVGIRSDVRHGFVFEFEEEPDFDLKVLESQVKALIAENLPVSYVDDDHVKIGETLQPCQAPRMHVKSTGEIDNFAIVDHFVHDIKWGKYMMIGQVGKPNRGLFNSMNTIDI